MGTLQASGSPCLQAIIHSSSSDRRLACPRKNQVNFDIVLDYGHKAHQELDALEEYLNAPPIPSLANPIGFWLKQWKAGEATGDLLNMALTQMALDYLSVPCLFFRISFMQSLILYFVATSVDPECLFSFSGGTITKLRNKHESARSVVMVGLWGKVGGLLAEQEFEAKIKEGWS
jgi:hypothetical protein